MVATRDAAGRARWLDIHKLQTIFIPALRHLCAVPDHHIELFPNLSDPLPPATPQNVPSTRPLVSISRSLSSNTEPPSSTPPYSHTNSLLRGQDPSLLGCRPYTIPDRTLHVVEICEEIAIGLEALLRAGHPIVSYTWADMNQDAHIATSHRIELLRQRYPPQLPPASSQGWDHRLPFNAKYITPDSLSHCEGCSV